MITVILFISAARADFIKSKSKELHEKYVQWQAIEKNIEFTKLEIQKAKISEKPKLYIELAEMYMDRSAVQIKMTWLKNPRILDQDLNFKDSEESKKIAYEVLQRLIKNFPNSEFEINALSLLAQLSYQLKKWDMVEKYYSTLCHLKDNMEDDIKYESCYYLAHKYKYGYFIDEKNEQVNNDIKSTKNKKINTFQINEKISADLFLKSFKSDNESLKWASEYQLILMNFNFDQKQSVENNVFRNLIYFFQKYLSSNIEIQLRNKNYEFQKNDLTEIIYLQIIRLGVYDLVKNTDQDIGSYLNFILSWNLEPSLIYSGLISTISEIKKLNSDFYFKIISHPMVLQWLFSFPIDNLESEIIDFRNECLQEFEKKILRPVLPLKYSEFSTTLITEWLLEQVTQYKISDKNRYLKTKKVLTEWLKLQNINTKSMDNEFDQYYLYLKQNTNNFTSTMSNEILKNLNKNNIISEKMLNEIINLISELIKENNFLLAKETVNKVVDKFEKSELSENQNLFIKAKIIQLNLQFNETFYLENRVLGIKTWQKVESYLQPFLDFAKSESFTKVQSVNKKTKTDLQNELVKQVENVFSKVNNSLTTDGNATKDQEQSVIRKNLKKIQIQTMKSLGKI